MKKKTTEEDKKFNRRFRKRSLLAFSVFLAFIATGVFTWHWLNKPSEHEDDIPNHLRTVLNANEKVNNAFFSTQHRVKEYPKSAAVKDVRVNGDVGMGDEFDPSTWHLTVIKHPESPDSVVLLGMANIRALPEKEMTFDFKCIEGWDQITNWGGARFCDFLVRYRLGTHSGRAPDPNHPEDLYKYVGLMTPDSAYYVGIDMKSMMHPQTLLCYEMNEDTLPKDQGAPLRLIIPIKYGIKSLKRIGYIYFSDTRPRDYWFERGYDYDAAL